MAYQKAFARRLDVVCVGAPSALHGVLAAPEAACHLPIERYRMKLGPHPACQRLDVRIHDQIRGEGGAQLGLDVDRIVSGRQAYQEANVDLIAVEEEIADISERLAPFEEGCHPSQAELAALRPRKRLLLERRSLYRRRLPGAVPRACRA